MQTLVINYIGRFLILVIIQIFVLNNIQISGYINPFLYVFFILILPFDTPKNLLLVLAFVLGLTIDMFSDTPGMHTSATVFMAFMRPGVIRAISIKKDFESKSFPGLHNMDASWIATYSFIMIFLHHTVLFFLEIFSLNDFFSTIWRSLLSSLITLVLVFISFLLESKPKSRR